MLLNVLISHPSSDLCIGSRLANALNINSYSHSLISVQSTGRTRSSSLVTLARPSVSSSLQITNRSFRYASPHLWNQLPSSFCQPHSVHSPPVYSPHLRYHVSLPWPFIPDLNISFTNPFLRSLSDSLWTAFGLIVHFRSFQFILLYFCFCSHVLD